MGNLPLYDSARSAMDTPSKISNHKNSGHAGLLFDKFVNGWGHDWKDGLTTAGKQGDPKRNWLKPFEQGCVGDRDAMSEAAARQCEMVTALGGKVFEAENTSPFVTGMGRAHPLENGFAWHPTLGAPYLPGSGLKGAVRDWAMNWVDGFSALDVAKFFGPKASEDLAQGSVIFFDMLPLAPVMLRMDVMTPHYGEYYQDKKVPGDWLAPVPVPFLTVDKGQRFQFAVVPVSSEALDDFETVCGWLPDMLSFTGIGGKTSSGYGRFEVKKAKEAAPVVLAIDGFIAWFDAQGFSASNKGEHAQIVDKIGTLEDPETVAAAKAHVKTVLKKKKECAPKLWALLQKGE